jgi:hypothetical protein
MLFTTRSKFCIKKSLPINQISNPISIGFIDKSVGQTGCYIILIQSKNTGGPNGIYSVSKSDISLNGTVTKLACSNGISGDSIDIEWQPQCFPHLILHYCNNNSNDTCEIIRFEYRIKVISC